MGAQYTQAQNQATQRYIKNHCDRIYLAVKKGMKDEIKAAAGDRSLNEYIMSAVYEKMAREKGQSILHNNR